VAFFDDKKAYHTDHKAAQDVSLSNYGNTSGAITNSGCTGTLGCYHIVSVHGNALPIRLIDSCSASLNTGHSLTERGSGGAERSLLLQTLLELLHILFAFRRSGHAPVDVVPQEEVQRVEVR